MKALFENYPIVASVLILALSLVVGAIELGAMRSRAPAAFTWVLGGMGLLAPVLSASYSPVIKLLSVFCLLVVYAVGINFVLKTRL